MPDAIRRPKPTRVFLGLNHGTGPISKLIMWVQDPIAVLMGDADNIPTHTRLGFEMDDGSRCYFEALETHGVRGPLPESKAELWARRKPERWTMRFWLPVSEGDAAGIYMRCQDTIGHWRYSLFQLVRMYLNIRFKVPVLSTAGKVVCSEAAARWTAGFWDLTAPGKTMDATTPMDQMSIAIDNFLEREIIR